MRATFIVAMLVVCAGCTSEPATPATITKTTQVEAIPGKERRIRVAAYVTREYAGSRLKEWDIRGRATGNDCRVLFIETPAIMERSMVEAMHYGRGTYSVLDRSIDDLYRQNTFRGVAYRDGSGTVMTFGDITSEEVEPPCH